MAKKHRLQIGKNPEKEYSGFVSFGLSSGEKDYRLAYFIGKELKINLERVETSEASKTSEVFQYADGQQKRKLCFFSNRQIEGLLVQQLKEADYFALVYCLEEDNFAREVKEAVIALPVVLSLF